MSEDTLAIVEKRKAAHTSVSRLIDAVNAATSGQGNQTYDAVNDLLQKLVSARELFNNLHFTLTQKLSHDAPELKDHTRQADDLRQRVEAAYDEGQKWILESSHRPGQSHGARPKSPTLGKELSDLHELQGDFTKYQAVATKVITELKSANEQHSEDIRLLNQAITDKDDKINSDAGQYLSHIERLERELRNMRVTSTPAKGSVGKGVTFDTSNLAGTMNFNRPNDSMNVANSNDPNVVNALLEQNTSMMQSFIAENRNQQRQYAEHIELPRTKLKEFNGAPLDYWPFIKSFDDMIGDTTLRPSKKLNALVNNCGPEVCKIIQSCQIMAPAIGYQKARAILKAKFGNPFHISQAWVLHMKSYPKLETPALVQAFSNDLICCRLTLSEMGYMSELQNTDNLTSLAARLPRYLRVKWRKANRSSLSCGSAALLDDMIDIVANAADESNDPVYNDDRLDGILERQLAEPKVVSNTGGNKRPGYHKHGHAKRAAVHGTVTDVDSGDGDDVVNEVDVCATFDEQISIMLMEGRKGVCLKCQGDHYTSQCKDYRDLVAAERLKFARDRKLCLLCLNPDHFLNNCKQKWTCQVRGCTFRHHTSLHDAFNLSTQKPKMVNCIDDEYYPEYELDEQADHADGAEVHTVNDVNIASLPIVTVEACGRSGKRNIQVLIDSGSTTSLITADLAKQLGLDVIGATILNVNTVVGRQRLEGELVDIGLRGIDEDAVVPAFELVTIPRLPVSGRHVATNKQLAPWTHLASVKLPDVQMSDVGILIGQDNAHLMEPLVKVKGDNLTDPFAIRTPLGWTVFGLKSKGSKRQVNATVMHIGNDSEASNGRLEAMIAKQWRLDKVPEMDHISKCDREVVQRWERSIHVKDGKFCVDIPFKREPPDFPYSRGVALACLKSLAKRLERNPVLHKKYSACMRKNLEKGYAEVAPAIARPGYELYLTHHAVEHARKPDVARMVLNGSLLIKGVSLNKMVHQGPDQSNKLITVLVNFRLYKHAFTGDVEAMYYRVLVPEEQRDALRFLWYEDGNLSGKVVEYRMQTHMFGGGWSSAVTTFAMRKTTEVFGEGFDDDVKETIKKQFYVDDCLKALPDVIKLIRVALGVKELLARASFNFTKIASNSAQLLEAFPSEQRSMGVKDLNVGEGETYVTHTLGTQWHPDQDEFAFVITIKETPDTRRGMASATAAVYDPMGLCAPFMIQAKRLGQILCKRKLSWDDKIPGDILLQWNRWKVEADSLSKFRVNRWLGYSGGDEKVTLHLFSDASEMAYGSVCYFIVANKDNMVVASTLLISRLRLAPLKTQSIPRLELCAAQMSVALEESVQGYFDFPLEPSQYWTDSVLVLRYVAGEPSDFKTFVANRVAEIQRTSVQEQWHHVPTAVNPADMLSRGVSATELADSKIWKHGPSFLMADAEGWPELPDFMKETVPSEEVKTEKVICATATTQASGLNDVWSFICRYSSWIKLIRAIAIAARFVCYNNDPVRGKKWFDKKPLSADELREAELKVVIVAQNVGFSDGDLASDNIKKLNPVRVRGVLRVGGRLNRADYEGSFKNPFILPAQSHVTELYIRCCHAHTFHSGVDRTLMETRERAWIVGGRNPVRSAIKACIVCRKHKSKPSYQVMADLPSFRVRSKAKPFDVSGVDYMGPLHAKVGRSEVKRYVMVVACAATRAVHLEWAVDLTITAFLNALNRFIARRGRPTKMISDNGTNFVGANAELKRLKSVCTASDVVNFCAERGVDWQFNAPGASHHGGFWERHNRTIRQMMMTVTKGNVMSDDTMQTLLCQIEYAINSRPLTRLSDDVNSLAPLTPNHFLMQEAGEPIGGEYFSRDLLQRRWRQTMKMLEAFWERWTKAYLSELQARSKWLEPQPDLQVGDLVLVAAENVPRMKWPLAIIIEVFPGSDKHVRTVRVRTAVGSYLRPISKIVLLESSMVVKG